jgi:peptidyl-prolyl cis-trans isomerase C
MLITRTLAVSLLLAAVALGGCNQKYSDDSKVLATVNGDDITEKDYENYLQLRTSQQGQIPDKDKEKKVVLDEMIDRLLLVQKGVALGYEKNPEIHFRLKLIRENLLAQEVVRGTLKDMQISDDDLKKRLTDELEKTHKTEYKVRHILVKTEDEAKTLAQQLKAGKKFEQAAKEKSLDTSTAQRGGDLGEWVNQGSGLVPEFFNAVIAMKKGQTSEPVKSDFGWHIIRVDDARPFKLPTVEQITSDPRAAANLRRRMQEEKLQNTLKEMKDKAKISIK